MSYRFLSVSVNDEILKPVVGVIGKGQSLILQVLESLFAYGQLCPLYCLRVLTLYLFVPVPQYTEQGSHSPTQFTFTFTSTS